MANKNPSKKGQFKKGQSGNPAGSSKKSVALKIMRSMSQDELADILLRLRQMTVADFELYASKDNKAKLTVQEAEVVAIINTIVKKGDGFMWNAIMDRIVGKPKASVDISSKDGSLAPAKVVVEIVNGSADNKV